MIKKYKQNVVFLKQTYFSFIIRLREITSKNSETACGNVYYINYKCKTLISAFCVIGNCPTPPTITEKKQSKEVEMFLINHDVH